MQSRTIRLAAVILMLLTSFSLLRAQTNTTALTGQIQDPSGASIVGGKVTIANPETGFSQTSETGKSGDYSFNQIPPGKYTVTVNYPGFSEQVQTVQLLVNSPLNINFKLTVGAAEVVNVETTLSAINSTDASLGKAFDSKQVQNLPYLANNVTYLLSLQPGVLALDAGATTGGLNTDTRTGIVNGARQDQTNITLDGVDNNDQTNGYAFNGALRATRESVEEFRVTTTNGNADAGRSSGGQVSLVTRSGTNAYHGSAYYLYRGPNTAANNWFTKQTQLAGGTQNRPLKVLQNTYGASFGAPIMKNKLFFFGAYEGFKQASSATVSETVPSIPGGGGLINGTVTYQACPAGATSCASSSVLKTLNPTDIAQMDPKCTTNGTCPNGPGLNAAAIAYFKTFPLANSNTGGDGYNTGTYRFSSPVPLHQITNIARVDYNINSKQSVFVRGNLQSDNQATALQFPGLPPASNIFSNNKGIAAGHIWSINDRMTNNFRYGFIRQGSATRGTGSQPYVSFSVISNISATTTSNIYIITTNNFADDFTYTKGRHTIQAGVNDRFVLNSRYFDSPLLSNASVSPNLLATAAIAGKGTSLDPGVFSCANCAAVATPFRSAYNGAILANTGVIESAQSGTEYLVKNNSLVPAGAGVVPTHIYRNFEQEYYIQDQWKATSHLTITAGLRYVYLGTPYEEHGQQIAPSTSLNTFLQNRVAASATGGSYNNRIAFIASGSANGAPNFWTPQKTNFAPRVSFAYSTSDNRTSIRGGFALAYDHLGEGIIDNYESTSSSLLSLSKTNLFTYSNIDTNPRFTGYHNVPLGAVNPTTTPLPATPADNPFTFLRSINSNIKTPYAETFNLSIQHEIIRGMTVTGSYVGRLGRHVLASLDVAQPSNLLDPGSNTTYFQAAAAYDKMIDAGVSPANVQDTGYFHNLFPNMLWKVGSGSSAVTYKGAQAYYASLVGDRGNETDTLYAADTNTSQGSLTPNTPSNQTFRFFYPQTSSIFAQSTVTNSNYNALQLSLRHTLKYGLEYDVNYTYSKSMDQGSSPERSSANLLTNTFNPSQSYAVSDYDARHNLTANYNVGLPFGKGKPFLNQTNGLVDRLIGGWQLNGVAHYSTGFPFSASVSGNYGTNFDTSSYYVQTGPIATGGHHYVAVSASGPYETALKNQTVAQAQANLRLPYAGEVGERNKFRGDGYFSLDDGLTKSFKTFREQEFRISVEVFNITNSVRFNTLQTAGNNTKFAQYTGTGTAPLLNNPRQMQFSGKYYF